MVVFDAETGMEADLPGLIAGVIRKRFEVVSPVVLRTREELAAAIANNPFGTDAGGAAPMQIVFLADLPAAERVAALDLNRSPGDTFEVVGREIYVRYGAGVAGTKLTNDYFDRTLGTASTGRNLRTANELLGMMDRG